MSPAFSSLRLSVLPLWPAATTMASAFSSRLLFRVSVNGGPALTRSIWLDAIKSIPVRFRVSYSSVAISESRKERKVPVESTSVTEQPSKAMMQAYSHPIGPAPTTTRLLGMQSALMKVLES